MAPARKALRAALGAALLSATLVLSGCATPPVSGDAVGMGGSGGPTVLGRFGLKASFLPEPAQGRFEWRWRGDQDHEVLVQDPWGQVYGIFRRSSVTPGPWAGWSLTDGRGKQLVPESRGNWQEASPLTPEALTALAEMLDTLGERLRPGPTGAATDPDPTVAFSLRQAQADHWIELRVVRDAQETPPCRQPAPC
jgi:hypothetical protein